MVTVPPTQSPETAEPQREAGIDWITVVAAGGKQARKLEQLAYDVRHAKVDACAPEKPFRLMQYEGVQWPGVRVGRWGAKCLVQLSGWVADESWTLLPSYSGRVTRLDVQTTTLLSRSQPAFGMRFLRRAATTRHHPQRLPPKIGKQRDNRGLFLGTVGKRTAPRYLRVYDKGIESNTDPAGLRWRVEVEAKATLAEELWKDLQKAKDVRQWCLDTCAEQWRLSGCCWPLGSSSRTGEPIRGPRPPASDAETLALWMRASVAPVVKRLLRVYSPAEVGRMIGLIAVEARDDDDPA